MALPQGEQNTNIPAPGHPGKGRVVHEREKVKKVGFLPAEDMRLISYLHILDLHLTLSSTHCVTAGMNIGSNMAR